MSNLTPDQQAQQHNRKPGGQYDTKKYAEPNPETGLSPAPTLVDLEPGDARYDAAEMALNANLPGAQVEPSRRGFAVTLPNSDIVVDVQPDTHIPDYWNAKIEGYDFQSSSSFPNAAVDLAALSAAVTDVAGEGLYNNVPVFRSEVVELVPEAQSRWRTETALSLEVMDPDGDPDAWHTLLVHPSSGTILEFADSESGTRIEPMNEPEPYMVAALQATEEIRDVLAKSSNLSLRARQMVRLDEPDFGDH